MRAQIQDKVAYMHYKARSRLFRLRHAALMQTLFGVEGELNGVTSFLGTPTQDPHDLAGDSGHERYHVSVTDEEDDATIKQNLARLGVVEIRLRRQHGAASDGRRQSARRSGTSGLHRMTRFTGCSRSAIGLKVTREFRAVRAARRRADGHRVAPGHRTRRGA